MRSFITSVVYQTSFGSLMEEDEIGGTLGMHSER